MTSKANKPHPSSVTTPAARTVGSIPTTDGEEFIPMEERIYRAQLEAEADAKKYSKYAALKKFLTNVMFAIVFILCIVIGTGPFIFIYLLQAPPPAVYTIRKVLTPNVKPGEPLLIEIAADVSENCEATVYRVIVDSSGRRHGFDPVPRSKEPKYIVRLITPIEAVAGPAYYSGRVEWECNWVQKWWKPQVVTQKNIDFNILPGDKTLPEIQQQSLPPGVPLDVPTIDVPQRPFDEQGALEPGISSPYSTDQWTPNQSAEQGYMAKSEAE